MSAPEAVVGIGASAGGLEALRSLITNLPANTGMAFIVAQHLAPQHASLLGQLLSRHTEMAVRQIVHQTAIERDTIYITPPNADVVVGSGVLYLHSPNQRGPKPSVDRLFTTLAEAYGSRAVAVVLSGTGSDGARGVEMVKARGGAVYVQSEDTAKYFSMPHSAFVTGCVDAMLSPDAIAADIQARGEGGEQPSAEPRRPTHGELDQVLERINLRSRIDFRGYKTKTLSRRIQSRMVATGRASLAEYVDLLDADGDEIERLTRACLISVTGFFRDPDSFHYLREQLARLHAERPAEEPLRVWVPACATGEEAYSLVMTIDMALPGRRVQVFGTDIDEQAVQHARRGLYHEAAIADIDTGVRERFFLSNGQSFQLMKRIRDRVVFARHDVIRDPLFLNLDLISCRNLLIYLKPSLQEELMRKFHHALRPGALLFLGRSESAPGEYYLCPNRTHKVFTNRAVMPGERKLPPMREWTANTGGGALSDEQGRSLTRADVLRGALSDHFAPAAVLLDSQFQLIEGRGEFDRYLSFGEGRPDLSLLSLAPKELTATLRAQWYRAKRSMRPSQSAPREVSVHGDRVRVATTVLPVVSPEGEQQYAVAFVEHARMQAPPRQESEEDRASEEQYRELERELLSTREHLQSVVEELEASNEELQSLNEELQSTNEEMQASNEELMASNEELQSTNEELTTVNEELEHKSADLSLMIEDLENIQDTLDSPLIVVDGAGRVRLLNRACRRVLHLTDEDMQAPISVLLKRFEGRGLVKKVQALLKTARPFTMRLDLQRRVFQVHGHPYVDRGYMADAPAQGAHSAVLLFQEMTGIVRANERLRRKDAQLLSVSARYKATLDSIPGHVAVVDADGTIVAVNWRWRTFAGEGDWIGSRAGVGSNYLELCDRAAEGGDDQARAVAAGIRAVLRREVPRSGCDYVFPSGGKQRWFQCSVTPLEKSEAGGAVVFHTEITEQVQARDNITRLATALQSAANGICIVDSEGRMDWVNEAFQRASGYSEGELLGHTQDLLEPSPPLRDMLTLLRDAAGQGSVWNGEVELINKGGQRYTVHQTITPIRPVAGTVTHFVLIQEDITEQKRLQSRLRFMAEHDELTGVWNRKSFQERLTSAIMRHQGRLHKLAVFFVDLDRFKDTNDTLGHFMGDQVLQAVARRLQGKIRDVDTLARFGGDEFAVFVEGLPSRSAAARVAESLLSAFQLPVEAEDRPVMVTASVGVTVFPDDGATAETLLRNADLAMYEAKLNGRRGYHFFDSKLELAMRERVELERDLAHAIEQSEFSVAFQPLVSLKSERPYGAECLLRWNRSEERRVSISKVIQVAEESGMILPIGHWVLRESFSQLGQWHAAGHPIELSLNLSAVQIHQQDVFGILTELAGRHGVPLKSVKVEITESVLLNRSTHVKETLHALRGAGIGLVLDDFGTGYASLSYLQQFPVGTVKIDGSFVRGIGSNLSDEAIVRGIIKLAHSLGQDVVAEGVETRLQLDFLKDCGCNGAQGYLFSRPMPPEPFLEYLSHQRVARIA